MTENTEFKGDEVLIRTDDGIIRAEVTEMIDMRDVPEDNARLGGTLEGGDTPKVHYVDYHHKD